MEIIVQEQTLEIPITAEPRYMQEIELAELLQVVLQLMRGQDIQEVFQILPDLQAIIVDRQIANIIIVIGTVEILEIVTLDQVQIGTAETLLQAMEEEVVLVLEAHLLMVDPHLQVEVQGLTVDPLHLAEARVL